MVTTCGCVGNFHGDTGNSRFEICAYTIFCMYVRMYVCVCLCVCVCVCVIYIFMYLFMYLFIYNTCVYVSTCIFTYTLAIVARASVQCIYLYIYSYSSSYMGWLRLVGSKKLQVSFEKEPYKRDYILHKRPII